MSRRALEDEAAAARASLQFLQSAIRADAARIAPASRRLVRVAALSGLLAATVIHVYRRHARRPARVTSLHSAQSPPRWLLVLNALRASVSLISPLQQFLALVRNRAVRRQRLPN